MPFRRVWLKTNDQTAKNQTPCLSTKKNVQSTERSTWIFPPGGGFQHGVGWGDLQRGCHMTISQIPTKAQKNIEKNAISKWPKNDLFVFWAFLDRKHGPAAPQRCYARMLTHKHASVLWRAPTSLQSGFQILILAVLPPGFADWFWSPPSPRRQRKVGGESLLLYGGERLQNLAVWRIRKRKRRGVQEANWAGCVPRTVGTEPQESAQNNVFFSFGRGYAACLQRLILRHRASSCLIVPHRASSCFIMLHRAASCSRRAPSCFIVLLRGSSWVIVQSSCVIAHLSWIILLSSCVIVLRALAELCQQLHIWHLSTFCCNFPRLSPRNAAHAGFANMITGRLRLALDFKQHVQTPTVQSQGRKRMKELSKTPLLFMYIRLPSSSSTCLVAIRLTLPEHVRSWSS